MNLNFLLGIIFDLDWCELEEASSIEIINIINIYVYIHTIKI